MEECVFQFAIDFCRYTSCLRVLRRFHLSVPDELVCFHRGNHGEEHEIIRVQTGDDDAFCFIDGAEIGLHEVGIIPEGKSFRAFKLCLDDGLLHALQPDDALPGFAGGTGHQQQKAEQRAEKAETELAQLRAEKQHAADVREVADATGAPVALLECCADRAAMDKLASEYQELAKAKQEPPRIAPTARASRIVHESGKADTRDIFADFMTELMK